MKKIIITASLGLLLPLLSVGQTTLGPGQIGTGGLGYNADDGTVNKMPHHFASQSWNTYDNAGHGQQICQPCHTPHNSKPLMGDGTPNTFAPLWNHTLSTVSYTFHNKFDNPAQVYDAANTTASLGISKLCLSCHDGSVALGAFGGQTGSTTMLTYNGGGANIGGADGTELSNDHPIGITYTYSTSTTFGARTNQYKYQTYSTSTSLYSPGTKYLSSLMKDGRVQCTSCHGAHSNSQGYQLGMNNAGSVLCLACHKK